MDYQTLLYEQDGPVVTITYNRPGQHNAINRRMNEELHHSFQRFRDDDSAFVLIITGAGATTFCAGWDLQDAAELTELGDYDRYRRSLYTYPGECGYTRRVDIFKPIIAAVNGYAFAAGLERRGPRAPTVEARFGRGVHPRRLKLDCVAGFIPDG